MSSKAVKINLTTAHALLGLVLLSFGILVFQVVAMVSPVGATGGVVSEQENTVVGPVLNEDGATTHLALLPTISPVPKAAPSGNAMQDAMTAVVPKGVPFYVAEGEAAQLIQGVSFDDPISSQRIWASLSGNPRFGGGLLQLPEDKEKRFERIAQIFTCDYCCGGPSRVTRIAYCGCAHSYAWKGMARFFLRFYGDKYNDEQIIGEMTRWKGLWYPQGMIQDYLVYTGKMSAS